MDDLAGRGAAIVDPDLGSIVGALATVMMADVATAIG
jgi:hypothetical protein